MKLRDLIYIFSSLWIFSIPLIFAQGDGYRYSGEFLDVGAGARALGMGGAFVAVADDGTTGYWSPAGLPSLQFREFSFMYSQQFSNLVKINFVSYVHPKSRFGAFGISWLRVGIDDIPRTGYIDANQNNVQDFNDLNENGIKDEGELYIEHPIQIGTFNDVEDGLFLSYGLKATSNLFLGVSLKMLRQMLADNTSNGVGIDLGLLYNPFKSFKLGINVQDMTKTKLKWDTATKHVDVIPVNFRVGSAYLVRLPNLKSELTLSWSLETKYGTQMRYGLEIWILKAVALRAGYANNRLSVGSGIRVASFQVDYAFLSHDDLGNSHRVSTSVKF